MNTKTTIGLAAIAAIGIVIAGIVIGNRKIETTVAPNQITSRPTAPAPIIFEPVPMPAAPVIDAMPPIVQATNTDVQPVAKKKKSANQNGQPKKAKPPIQDPDARDALSLVGADPVAEEYWVSAINNPNLPAEERKDLIEDLNEDGLSDPHHPGPQDMPLILSRIQLIEELAPDSMDQVNADAFAEAYKDLVNLASGQPAD
jgi:hypothetical protein